jgi:Transposase DDE domain
MPTRGGSVHVVTTRRHYKDKVYETHLLRRTYREAGKVKNETVGNLSHLPPETIELVRRSLKGETFVAAGGHTEIGRSLPHGHVALVWAMARRLGLPGLLGPAGRDRDLAMALIVARVLRPASKLATTRWWADTTLAVDLGVADATTDEVYAAMDWLVGRQPVIERTLARRHLRPGGLAYYDLSSSYVEGRHCELAARGYSRDQKIGKDQIEYALLTDVDGRPVSVEVFPGNTADPAAFTKLVDRVRTRFKLDKLVLVGDRGMITSARVEALRELGGLGWVTCLRASQIATLAQADKVQLSLFDQANVAEITHPDFPGERLVCCRNPALATERARKRTELLAATEAELAKVARQVERGRLVGADKIGLRVGKVVGRYKMAKHFQLHITDTQFAYTRRAEQIAAEAALDGIYIIRTSVAADQLDTTSVVEAYKRLANVERDFRSLKTIDLHVRPIHHHLADRVRAHVLVCMLACYLLWHLRRALAPLTFTDTHPPERADPVAPAQRSPAAQAKASRQQLTDGTTAHSLRTLLDHLATLTRNQTHFTDPGTPQPATVELLATPTPLQRRAFELVDAPIPLTIR